ncbi:MAG: lipopolysaccharide biosynthesis protein [Deltaproteobacteria bacterium]|nr:lipopolysaccharide biosynthesis protein [Deltaproteobacteria bacterium]
MFGIVEPVGAERMRRDVAWNMVPVALLGVVGLALNFTIASHWGAAPLGAFNIVTTAMFAFAVIGAGGLQFAVLRAVAEDPDDRARVAAVVVGALVPNVVLAAIATVAFVVLRGPIGDLVGSSMVTEGILWSAPGLFCFGINKTLLGVVNGLRRMRAFALYTSLRYLLLGTGLVIALSLDLPAHQLPVIWTITECTLQLVLVVELFATVDVRRATGWQAWTRKHLHYGARSVLATLGMEINQKLDLWVVGVVLPDAEVGIYSLAAVVYEGSLQLSTVVQNNVNPLLARHLAAGQLIECEGIVSRSRRWFVPAMIGACAIGAALYPYVIPRLTKPEFAAGALPFAFLMGGIAVASPYLPFNQMLLMASRPGWHTVYIVGWIAVAAVALSILTPMYGIAGAGAATAIALAASALLLRWFVRSRIGIRI